MNKQQTLLPLATSLLLLSSCHLSTERNLAQEISQVEVLGQTIDDSPIEIRRNGKIVNRPNFTKIYQEDPARVAAPFPAATPQLITGLENQRRLLKKRKKRAKDRQIGDLQVSHRQLQETVDILQQAVVDPNFDFSTHLTAHQISGKDNMGNVNFTGYFTPVLKVSEVQSEAFPYPLYTRPLDWVGPMPTREEIDGVGVLQGQGLELAYASNAIDVYFMHVQGSGIVEYPDGRQVLFSNNGHNSQPYRSIGRYMIKSGMTTPQHVSINSIKKILARNPQWKEEVLYSNPSYVFFRPLEARPTGAGQVPLTADYSIAVDPKYIPLGACLMAAVPMHNNKGVFTHHEYRILLAQDTGGAIKGTGHVDVYTGIGKKAKRQAGYTHHYGGLWLLMPNENTQVIP